RQPAAIACALQRVNTGFDHRFRSVRRQLQLVYGCCLYRMWIDPPLGIYSRVLFAPTPVSKVNRALSRELQPRGENAPCHARNACVFAAVTALISALFQTLVWQNPRPNGFLSQWLRR